jgi:peroxiredoxin
VQLAVVLAQESNGVRRYIEETGLPFNVLIDDTRRVAKAYGVWDRIGIASWNIAKPATFLIARDGTIRYSFVAANQREFPSHDELIAAIESLPQG